MTNIPSVNAPADVDFVVKASVSTFQRAAGILIQEHETAIITVSGSWVTHPPGSTGAGGLPPPAPPATPYYYAPGRHLGCLLVKDGDGLIQAWDQNDETKQVHVKGEISFVANDAPDPAPNTGAGFADNSGELKVHIHIE